MKERPILFSGPMIRAILGGTKTQTRRVVKPQPIVGVGGYFDWKDGSMDALMIASYCPYGAPGDRLWVREAWRPDYAENEIRYSADMNYLRFLDQSEWFANDYRKQRERTGFRPSIHMPRWASRITLEVADVRATRLQDITNEDAKAEGVAGYPAECYQGATRAMFLDYWDVLNAKRGHEWLSNPWVWAIEFKRVTP